MNNSLFVHATNNTHNNWVSYMCDYLSLARFQSSFTVRLSSYFGNILSIFYLQKPNTWFVLFSFVFICFNACVRALVCYRRRPVHKHFEFQFSNRNRSWFSRLTDFCAVLLTNHLLLVEIVPFFGYLIASLFCANLFSLAAAPAAGALVAAAACVSLSLF